MNPVVFDAETGPLPIEELQGRMPEFEAPANYKDPAKIEAAIAEKRAQWLERAALSAVTGRVLAIGYLDANTVTIDDGKEFYEREILQRFWRFAESAMPLGSDRPFVGWNIFGFDLPFIIRRSWANDVPVPEWVRRGRYWHDLFIDLMEVWALGQRDGFTSLDDAAVLTNAGRKTGRGADFAKLLDEDREKARQYLANDLLLTARVGQRMGRIEQPQPAASAA